MSSSPPFAQYGLIATHTELVSGSLRSGPRVLAATRFTAGQSDILGQLLELDGVEFVQVDTGAELIAEAASRPCALALVDDSLPDIAGIEICRRLTSLLPVPIPVVVRLAEDSLNTRLIALRAGAMSCLPAAADINEIHLHLRNFLRLARMLPAPPMTCVRNALGLGQCVLDMLPGAVIITDHGQRVVDVNAAFTTIAGVDSCDLLNLSLHELFGRCQFTCDLELVIDKLATEGAWQCELHGRSTGAEPRVFWLHAQTLNGKCGQRAHHHIFFFSDIAHQKRQEQRLRTLAETDALTGVANRNLFLASVNEAIESAESGGEEPAILFLDLDGFKEVNCWRRPRTEPRMSVVPIEN